MIAGYVQIWAPSDPHNVEEETEEDSCPSPSEYAGKMQDEGHSRRLGQDKSP